MNKEYEIVIGLEVHAELSTKTKIFCSCSTKFGSLPNSQTCPTCMAMPGTLPVLNEKVVEYAVRAGLATNCEIARVSKNDRKNYFYPDLPASYQISQLDEPICGEGYIEVELPEGPKKVRLTRIHIEQDAGKLNHSDFDGSTLVDLNRAGIALVEIVSEPDMRSAEEVEVYLRKLKSILEYIDVSDCKMQEGSLRADVNVSVRKFGQKEYGTRAEMKNLNSFRSIVRAINYESNRQIEELEKGNKIIQETLRWDDVTGVTSSMRSKEDAQDYRYFPDPDLGLIQLSEEYIENIKASLPEMPEIRKDRYIKELGLPEYDARLITSSKHIADIFDEANDICNKPKAVSNWIMSDIFRIIKEKELDEKDVPFSGKELAKLIEMIDKGIISSSIGKKVIEKLFEKSESPEKIVEENGWLQISNEGEIRTVIIKILENNSKSVEDYKAGKEKALGFLVGQAMKETKGKANPGMLNTMFKEELSK